MKRLPNLERASKSVYLYNQSEKSLTSLSPSPPRLSQDYLTQQVRELTVKVKDLEKKRKKAPEDMKSKLKVFLEDAHKVLDELNGGLKNVELQVTEIAEYFCEDPKKFKIEVLFVDLLSFIRTYEGAVEVHVVCSHCSNLLYIIFSFLLSALPPLQENRQRVILEEKRRKREEARKAAAEKKAAAKGKTAEEPPPEEEGTEHLYQDTLEFSFSPSLPPSPLSFSEGCVIDNLLKEIRSGTTLRTTKRKSTHRAPKLSAKELERLKKIAAHVVDSSAPKSSDDGEGDSWGQVEVKTKETVVDEHVPSVEGGPLLTNGMSQNVESLVDKPQPLTESTTQPPVVNGNEPQLESGSLATNTVPIVNGNTMTEEHLVAHGDTPQAAVTRSEDDVEIPPVVNGNDLVISSEERSKVKQNDGEQEGALKREGEGEGEGTRDGSLSPIEIHLRANSPHQDQDKEEHDVIQQVQTLLNYSSVEHGIAMVSSLATLALPPLSGSFDQVGVAYYIMITSSC